MLLFFVIDKYLPKISRFKLLSDTLVLYLKVNNFSFSKIPIHYYLSSNIILQLGLLTL